MLRKWSFVVAVFASAGMLFTDAARAALTPTSTERNLSANPTGGQKRPAITIGADGFVAVWEDSRVGPNLRARRIGTTGQLLGEEVQVDAGDGSENAYPDIVAVDSGFVVVWRKNDASDEEPPGIVGRMLDGNGTPVGEEFGIDTPREVELDEYYLSAPRVAANGDGFVVVWSSGREIHSPYPTEYDTKVFARHFSKLGAPTGDEIPVFPLSGSHFEPDIGATQSGFAVVTRFIYYSAHGNSSTYAQLLDSAGARSGDPLEITRGFDAGPMVVTHAGDVVVLWNAQQTAYAPDEEPSGLRGRRYDLSGESFSEEFALNTAVHTSDAGLRERDSAGSALEADRFVAVWSGGAAAADNGTEGLWAQAFGPDGRRTSPRRKINGTDDAGVAHPGTAILDNSTLAVVWSAGDEDVFVRTFAIVTAQCGDADGNGATTSTDALTAIRAAVGTSPCAPCICDADGSGAHAASDALAVLRAAVGVPVALACPICTEGAGTAFQLDADRDCYGAHIEIPRGALPADLNLISCTTDPALVPNSCDASLEVGGNGVVFDMRGCGYRDTVFSCILPATATAALTEQANVKCGCGCGDCPIAPKLCETGHAGESCSNVPASAPAIDSTSASGSAPIKPAAGTGSVTSTTTEAIEISTTTSSSVSFCGTCCNLEELGQIEVASPSPTPLTELLVRVKSDYRGECVFCYRDLANYTGDVHTGNDDYGGDSVSICVVDHDGFDAEGVVAGCEGHGLFETGAATVVYARGMNFEAVDPLPSVVVNPVPE